jgi:hypothetical protein
LLIERAAKGFAGLAVVMAVLLAFHLVTGMGVFQ